MSPSVDITADVTRIAGGQIDIKLVIDGDLRLLRWRRRMLCDEVLLDGRRVRTARGMFGRETVFGLTFNSSDDFDGPGQRLLLTVDPTTDWCDPSTWADDAAFSRPRGVRLETADKVLLAHGSLSSAHGDSRAGQPSREDGWDAFWSAFEPRAKRWFGWDGTCRR